MVGSQTSKRGTTRPLDEPPVRYADRMNHAEAQARCDELNTAGDEALWIPQKVADDDWRAVSVQGLPPRGPLKATVEVRTSPEVGADPRSGLTRNIPPYGA